MGLVTLLVFPIPVFLALYFTDGITLFDFLFPTQISIVNIVIGVLIGVAYALIANRIMKHPIFDDIPIKVDELVKSMNLTIFDSIFLSLCAGIGEELLFRVGFQHYLGVIITSILFVAIHGYLNPFNWKFSLYGLVVLPLSFLLGYGYTWYGLWFVIALHTSYDLTLFLAFKENKEELVE
ncbi:MAG: CPBP family intramembrane metalloprotease [Crocinitomicaceae bacterium]|nr:CPBP family intramembrane metalloprotease [Crocinitomicaceae bacterium]